MKIKSIVMPALLILTACSGGDDEQVARQPYSAWQDYYSSPNEATYISSMAFDDRENLWITSHYDTASLRKFDGETLTYYHPDDDDLLNDTFTLVYEDEERKFWQGHGVVIAYTTGIRQHYAAPYRYWSVYTTQSAHKSSRIQVGADGTLWDANYLSVGYPYDAAPEGLRKYDGTTWTVFDTENSPLPTNHIAALCFDRAGNLLVSTLPESGQAGTVLKFDGTNWSTVYQSPVPGYWISSIVVDAAGILWMGELNREAIGNDYGGGLWALTGTSLRNYTVENSSLSSNSIVELTLDKNESLWIGTYAGGLVKFDRNNTWQTINSDNSPLPDLNSVELIRPDTEGNLWIAVQFFGLARITP